MTRPPRDLRDIAEQNARDNNILNDAQSLIDDALELAALIMSEVETDEYNGNGSIGDVEQIANKAEGILAQSRYVLLATYVLEPAMRDHKRTRGGLLRSFGNTGFGDV